MAKKQSKSKKKTTENDLGFGEKLTSENVRLLNQDGSFNIERRGYNAWQPYLAMVEMTWGRFFLVVLGFYIGINALFALLYMLVGLENINGIEPSNFLTEFSECFFFSVQTFTTVGYGAIAPNGFLANMVAAFGALVGLLCFALATGLLFARFSRPEAHILFSEKAIISPYKGKTSLQFRIANTRNNNIIKLQGKITMSWLEKVNGRVQRRYVGLPLERNSVFMFPLNWTIVHPINKDSPLYQKTAEDLARLCAEFLILIEGHDETFATTVHRNSSYSHEEIAWNVRFKPMYRPDEDGQTILYLDEISETIAVE